jgi:hypothetical protein
VPSLRTSRISYVVLGSIPATKKFVLFPGATGRVLVFLQDGESPAILNWTNSVPAEVGGALYRATSGLSVGVMTAWDPVTREATASAATAEQVSVAWYPSLTVTSMSYVPSCIGVQVNALLELKSRTTWKAPPWGAALNW